MSSEMLTSLVHIRGSFHTLCTKKMEDFSKDSVKKIGEPTSIFFLSRKKREVFEKKSLKM